MNREIIRGWIVSLASSQGFYGRLLETLDQNPELWEELEKQDFKDAVDFVMFMEA